VCDVSSECVVCCVCRSRRRVLGVMCRRSVLCVMCRRSVLCVMSFRSVLRILVVYRVAKTHIMP